MPEFTGERLIPELVEADLLNEHMARYVLARALAQGAVVLDAGCGVGYGTAELATTAASVTGLDSAPDAIAEARHRYPALHFVEGGCERMPLDAAHFDLVVAFEVIEHLDDWRAFLLECVRVLKPSGRLLVSTPNKTYYAESRRQAGPNPFHRHEFGFPEFQAELSACFRHVTMLLQNHAEGVLIAPPGPLVSGELSGARDSTSQGVAEDAHFFLALCSQAPIQTPAPLFYLPGAGNVLRERERHIELLSDELALKNREVADRADEHRHLVERFRTLQAELEEHNRWAAGRQQESVERGARIVALQQELEERHRWALDQQRESLERGQRIVALQQEIEERNRWAADREREAAQRGERIVSLQHELAAEQERAQAALDQVHLELQQRTEWALGQDCALQELKHAFEKQTRDLDEITRLLEERTGQFEERTTWARLERSRAEALESVFKGSRWLRLGRRLGLGPRL